MSARRETAALTQRGVRVVREYIVRKVGRAVVVGMLNCKQAAREASYLSACRDPRKPQE